MEITTLRTVCPESPVCPSVHRIDTDSENLYVILKKVTDPDVLAGFASLIAPDEILGTAPNALFPEVQR